MSRLKNLYALLMGKKRLGTLDQWLADYMDFTTEVGKIRDRLKNEDGSSIRDEKTYAGTRFANDEAKPFQAFVHQLIYARYNGIASRGQSVLSKENYQKLIQDENFLQALDALIKQPDEASHFEKFRKAWLDIASNRPLLINRVLAACTTNVSTTVDEDKFDIVNSWLIDKRLIPDPVSHNFDWRAKNVHLMAELRTQFRDELREATTDPHRLSVFVWELYEKISNPFSLKKQEVRYGAPGTGKTYTARQNAELLFEMWKEEFDPRGSRRTSEHIEKVQFHPSYSYEDFMEGLRPMLFGEQSQLRLQNGIFKELCKRAAQWEIDVFEKVSPESAERWASLTVEDLLPHRENLKATIWGDVFSNDKVTKVSDAVPPYFLIIDEMNRADLSRVLGELMYCLEYRGIEGAIQTQYANLNDASTGMIKMDGKFRFFVPHNLYLIGTMNTIDRSVESFDFALRRRFRWEKVEPNYDELGYHLKQNQRRQWAELAENLRKLNEVISEESLLGPDFQIGHAYLMNLAYPASFSASQVRTKLWEDSIKPLLEEYLRGTGKTVELLDALSKGFGIRR